MSEEGCNFLYIDVQGQRLVGWGTAKTFEEALGKTSGRMMQVTEAEYNLIVACRGNLKRGKYLIDRILDEKVENWQGDDK